MEILLSSDLLLTKWGRVSFFTPEVTSTMVISRDASVRPGAAADVPRVATSVRGPLCPAVRTYDKSTPYTNTYQYIYIYGFDRYELV